MTDTPVTSQLTAADSGAEDARLKPIAAGPQFAARVDTPLGDMLLAASGAALTGAWFVDQDDVPSTLLTQDDAADPETAAVLARATEQLIAWFAGQRRDFDLPLAASGTPFQHAVWRGLLDLPFGQTCSYGDLAHRIGRPRAVRAVAQAVGRNPISIVIPCHRIVGHDTSLTGFGGGLIRKRSLLAHEGHIYAGPSARAKVRASGQLSLDWV